MFLLDQHFAPPKHFAPSWYLEDGGGSNGGAESGVDIGGFGVVAVSCHQCVKPLFDPLAFRRPVQVLPMYVQVCVYMYVYVCKYMYVSIEYLSPLRTVVHVSIYDHSIRISTTALAMHVCMCVCVCVCVCICICVCVCMCMHMRMYIYMHMYVHT